MKPKTLLLTTLLLTASLWGGFSHIDCSNEGNLSVLQITEGDCRALEAFWDATGQGDGWNDTTGWDELPLRSVTEWAGYLRLNEDNRSLGIFSVIDQNISGTLPEALSSFTDLKVFSVQKNHFSNLPDSIKNMQSLTALAISYNEYTGALPSDLNLPNLERLYLNNNNFIGTIPESYADLKNLEDLILYDNNLSGPLPDLSALTQLDTFLIYHNQFTFADIEPQMGWVGSVSDSGYIQQIGQYESSGYGTDYPDPRGHCHNYYTDERYRKVYFEHTLTIEPREVPQNTYSDNDFFAWFKYTYADGEQDVTTDGSRIYIKENATTDDEGYYYYEANNSVVTLPQIFSTNHYYCSTPRTDGIQAIHDNAPAVDNYPPTHLEIHVGDTYSYTPSVTDADGDPLQFSIVNKPDWIIFDSATGKVEGSPVESDIGTYDINLTVSDLTPDAKPKISVPIHYTLTVLPVNVTAITDGYRHDTTHNEIISSLTPTLQAYLESDPQSFGFIESNSCDSGSKAYIGLESSGALITGYKVCNTGDFSATLATGSTYPNATTATLLPDATDSTKAMIMIDIPLGTNSITIGE